jgi:hypothetical protein
MIKCHNCFEVFTIQRRHFTTAESPRSYALLSGQRSLDACCWRHQAHNACCVACQKIRFTFNGSDRDDTDAHFPKRSSAAGPLCTRSPLCDATCRASAPSAAEKVKDSWAAKRYLATRACERSLATAVVSLQQPCEAFEEVASHLDGSVLPVSFRQTNPTSFIPYLPASVSSSLAHAVIFTCYQAGTHLIRWCRHSLLF